MQKRCPSPIMTWRVKAASLIVVLSCTGCATWFRGQVAVPGTGQRIIVGCDHWPTKKIWILENGELTSPKIVYEGR